MSLDEIQLGNRRLLKLARFLDTLPEEEFNINDWVTRYTDNNNHICGTVCCAIGWLPRIFPTLWEWRISILNTVYPHFKDSDGGSVFVQASEFFYINNVYYLFDSYSYNEQPKKITPKDVADRIREVVNRRKMSSKQPV